MALQFPNSPSQGDTFEVEYQAGFKKYEREADNTYVIPAVDAEGSAY